MTGGAPEAPVREEALLEELQRRTLEAWSDELADLRVKPFTDQPGSVLISGTLGRSGSPLEALFRAVWHEVGGDDRSRSHLNQLRVATRVRADDPVRRAGAHGRDRRSSSPG